MHPIFKSQFLPEWIMNNSWLGISKNWIPFDALFFVICNTENETSRAIYFDRDEAPYCRGALEGASVSPCTNTASLYAFNTQAPYTSFVMVNAPVSDGGYFLSDIRYYGDYASLDLLGFMRVCRAIIWKPLVWVWGIFKVWVDFQLWWKMNF